MAQWFLMHDSSQASLKLNVLFRGFLDEKEKGSGSAVRGYSVGTVKHEKRL